AVIIPGEAALTQRGAPVGNRLARQHRPLLQCLIAAADGWITLTSQSVAPSTPACRHG
ncbi:Acetyl-CoA decarbonylase/synthase complex subunit epsilon 2, partial [Dissostichus eleginoides]